MLLDKNYSRFEIAILLGICLAILAVGGHSVSVFGQLYGIDFFSPLVLVFATVRGEIAGVVRQYWRVIAGGAISVVLFLIFDLANGMDKEMYMRGIGRNFGFLFSLICGLYLLRRYGAGVFFYITASLMLSIPVALRVTGQLYVSNYVDIFKLNNGIFIVLFVPMFVFSYSIVAYVFFIAYAGFLYLFAEFRSAAACVLLIPLGFIVRPLLRKIPTWIIFPLVVTILPLGTSLALNTFRQYEIQRGNEDKVSRMEESNKDRYGVAQQAFFGILERPVTGYGTWQHAFIYFSTRGAITGDALGVHSMPLQLGYEYGISGLLLGLYFGLVMFFAGIRLLKNQLMEDICGKGVLCLGLYLMIIGLSNVIFGGVMGWSRISVGLQVAFAIWVLKFPVKKTARENRESGKIIRLGGRV